MPRPIEQRRSGGSSRVIDGSVNFLPSSPESEKRVLGAILTEPTVGNSVFNVLVADDFFSTTHGNIFVTLEALCREKKSFDLYEVLDRAREDGTEIDIDEITVLLEDVVLSSLDHHVQRVKDAAVRRGVLVASRDAIEATQEDVTESVHTIAERASHSILEVLPRSADSNPDPGQEPKLLEFPLEVFPVRLREILSGSAEALHCPVDFLAVPLLVTAGTAIGTSRAVSVKPGWTEMARIWAAIVAEPGSRKSPALALMMRPFEERNRQLQAEFQTIREDYQHESAGYEIELTRWKKSLHRDDATSDERPTEPEPPRQSQVFTTDSTIEALGDLLQRNPRGILFFRDELVGWALSMDQYRGRGADRQTWLSFWSGGQTIVNRKSQDSPTMVENPFVGVVGALPPDMLGQLSAAGGAADGFIDRILFTYPDPLPSSYSHNGLDPSLGNELSKIFEAIWGLKPGVDESGQETPSVVTFDQCAVAVWCRWMQAHLAEQDDIEFPENLRGPWAKLEGYCARLALILHTLYHVCDGKRGDTIDDEIIACAWALVDYFKSHARRVYPRLRATEEDRHLAMALRWIRRQEPNSHGVILVKSRDLQMHRVGNVKNSEQAKTLLQELEGRGFGWTRPTSRGSLLFILKRSQGDGRPRNGEI